jgi:hypothetical protein
MPDNSGLHLFVPGLPGGHVKARAGQCFSQVLSKPAFAALGPAADKGQSKWCPGHGSFLSVKCQLGKRIINPAPRQDLQLSDVFSQAFVLHALFLGFSG